MTIGGGRGWREGGDRGRVNCNACAGHSAGQRHVTEQRATEAITLTEKGAGCGESRTSGPGGGEEQSSPYRDHAPRA